RSVLSSRAIQAKAPVHIQDTMSDPHYDRQHATLMRSRRMLAVPMLREGVPLESVRKHQAGLQSFRSMRRIEASRRNASALRLRFSQSLASLRQRLSQAKVRSTTQRRGSTTNPFVRSERLTISISS